jgi:hypothetical protein
MAAVEEHKCYTCDDEDTGSDEWPCTGCDPYRMNEWRPKRYSDGVDLWDM